MRVLHLDSGREMRGGQRQVLFLYRGLRKAGIDQALLCRGELLRTTEGQQLSAGAVWQAGAECDLIHAHDARTHTLALVFGRGRPVVVSRRVAFPLRDGALSRWKYRRAALYLAVSEFVRDRLREAKVPAERISVVPDGVPVPRSVPPGRPMADPPVVVALASEDPGKCAALASEACTLAGVDLRFSSNLDVDLAQADIFLYLTENEGLGSALILASMWAKPIVASDVGGVPEVVADGETGLLVENDARVAARALARLWAEPELAGRLGEAAQARATAELSDDKMIARTLEAYQSVLSASPAK